MPNITVVRASHGMETDAYTMNDLRGKRSPRGAVGCYLSHLRLLKHIRDSGLESALILEDDARLTAGPFAQSIRDASSFGWDMLYFGYNNLGKTRSYACTARSGHWCKIRGTVSDTVAYAVNRFSAIRIIHHLERALRENATAHPVDLELWTLQPDLNMHITFPEPIVVQRDRFRDSDISFYSWAHMQHRPRDQTPPP